MKRRKKTCGFTLIELLVTLAVVGVFLVVLAEFIAMETKLTQETEAMCCIEDEEHYISEYLFETLYSVEEIEIRGDGDIHQLSDFDFSYVHNCCPILGSTGDKTIRFVHEGSQLKICDIYNGIPQIKKAIAYHIANASCELIQADYPHSMPVIHVSLEFEAGHTRKSYDLLFAMRNVS